MLNPTDIVFFVTSALEAAVITIGNTFTIFVFWSQRSHLKRTYYLLINLAVADLFVGITEPIVLGTEKIPRVTALSIRNVQKTRNPWPAIQLLGSSTSVIFLALISLERAHAVLRPFRHRVTSMRIYIYAMVIAWAAGLCITGTKLLTIYHTNVDREIAGVIIHSCLFLCVFVICSSFIAICNRLRSATPQPEIHRHQSASEKNLRLSRTFFQVAALSLMFWLPAVLVYTIKEFCREGCGISPPVVSFVNSLHLANSMVNPFVYCFRMPVFKNALKKCCSKRVDNIETRPVPLNVSDNAVEFTTGRSKKKRPKLNSTPEIICAKNFSHRCRKVSEKRACLFPGKFHTEELSTAVKVSIRDH